MLQLIVQSYVGNVMEFQEFISKVNNETNWQLEDSGEQLTFIEAKPIPEAAKIVQTKDSLFIFVAGRDTFIVKHKDHVYSTYGMCGMYCGKVMQQLARPTEEDVKVKATKVKK